MYKIYTVRLEKNYELPLLAKHNREAMKLSGKIAKWYGEIKQLIDDRGEIVIHNE